MTVHDIHHHIQGGWLFKTISAGNLAGILADLGDGELRIMPNRVGNLNVYLVIDEDNWEWLGYIDVATEEFEEVTDVDD